MRRWVSITILLLAIGAAPARADEPRRPPPATEIKTPGYLVVYSTPFARLHVDGKDTGRVTPITPRARIELMPGRHKLTFIVGDKKVHYAVMIEAGKTTKIMKQLPTAE